MGKEAAALHMGASLGDLVARPLKLRPLTGVWKGGSRADGAGGTSGGERRSWEASASGGAGNGGGASGGVHAYAASCGMAACFAALFFAPWGRRPSSSSSLATTARFGGMRPFMLLACFVAFGLASIIGIGDVIPKVPLPALSWPVVGQCVVIAVACALVGNRLHSNHRRRPTPHQAHLAELLSVGGPGRRAHGGAGHAVRLARVPRARAPICSPTRWPAALAGGPSP